MKPTDENYNKNINKIKKKTKTTTTKKQQTNKNVFHILGFSDMLAV